MRLSSLKVAVLLLVSALSCTSAAMWTRRLSTLGLVKTDVVSASVSVSTPPSAEVDAAAEQRCLDQIGKVENGVIINTMPKYDVAKILEEHGGVAGKLNVTRNKDVPESPVADSDNTTYWVYDYRRSDFKTFVRLEHGLLRHKGMENEFVDVRGELYWTPPDFCGRLRHAKYRVDPEGEGFSADVTLEYCFLTEETLSCGTPAECRSDGTHQYCVG